MFGLEYIMAFVDVAFKLAFALVSAIPVTFFWNRLAPIYLGAVTPELYLSVSYKHWVGIIFLLLFAAHMLKKFLPSFSINNSNATKGA